MPRDFLHGGRLDDGERHAHTILIDTTMIQFQTFMEFLPVVLEADGLRIELGSGADSFLDFGDFVEGADAEFEDCFVFVEDVWGADLI